MISLFKPWANCSWFQRPLIDDTSEINYWLSSCNGLGPLYSGSPLAVVPLTLLLALGNCVLFQFNIKVASLMETYLTFQAHSSLLLTAWSPTSEPATAWRGPWPSSATSLSAPPSLTTAGPEPSPDSRASSPESRCGRRLLTSLPRSRDR